jgi:elongation factor Ts
MIDKIKQLREKTGISIAECKKALELAGGDMDKAREVLKEKALSLVEKKSEAETKEGVVESYIHANGKIGVLLELDCQTDFVAKNSEFQALARDLAMHIAASNPQDQASLLSQAFIKDQAKTIQDLLNERIAKFGENIKISRFTRYQI